MEWTYLGEAVTEAPKGMYGFVYQITNLTTGRKYIGKKTLWHSVVRPPLKGKKRRRRSIKESDWRSYTGSCDELNQDIQTLGDAAFEKVILKFCESKSKLSYFEAKYQFDHDVLLSDDWYNGWINYKGMSKHLK